MMRDRWIWHWSRLGWQVRQNELILQRPNGRDIDQLGVSLKSFLGFLTLSISFSCRIRSADVNIWSGLPDSVLLDIATM